MLFSERFMFDYNPAVSDERALVEALDRYEHSRQRGARWRFFRRCIAQSPWLTTPQNGEQQRNREPRITVGSGTTRVCEVFIDTICGSEMPTRDYDGRFYPVKRKIRERWKISAMRLLSGRAPHPVKLLRIRDRLYVRDGHAQISAARALGRKTIDAEIVISE